MSALKHMTVEQLVDQAYHAEPGMTAPHQELKARLTALRSLVSGDRGAIDAVLNGQPLTFVQLLDKIMDEMERAGVADAQGRSLEDAENEPHRAAAYDYRAMLEERAEKIGSRAQLVLDGGK